MKSRYAARVDATQPDIVYALQAVGALVLDLSRAGGGVPDLLVYFRGRYFLLECKSTGGTLTPAQLRTIADGWPVLVVDSPHAALVAIGAMRPDAA